MSNFSNYKLLEWKYSKLFTSLLSLFIIWLKNKVKEKTKKFFFFINRLSLEVMTLNPVCEHVETAQGVPLTVTGVAQVKFSFFSEYILLFSPELFLVFKYD